MLTVAQKANILRKAGIPVPPGPGEDSPEDGTPLSAAPVLTAEAWAATVNVVFVTYAAARAAKSLRDAEEARQLQTLRQLSAGFSRGRGQSHRA
jgi:hypothetical protein